MKRLLTKINLILLTMTGLGITTITNCSAGNTNFSKASPYEIVVDAGSSGSRVYVYSKLPTESGLVINDLYESKINMPLVNFVNNPESAGRLGIQPLLESAINFIKQSTTNGGVSQINLANIPTSVLGTAGMRLVSEAQQKAIYKNIVRTILANGLKLNEVRTITGQHEGIYSWADVNYLQNNFNSSINPGNLSNSDKITTGIFEMGGASAQISFVTPQAPSESIIAVRVNNKLYNVYAISFLGLGQDAARDSMNKLANYNACYPNGYNANLSNVSVNIKGNFNFDSCNMNYNSITASFPEINHVRNVLGYATTSFVGIASIYYALNFWHIESQPSLLNQNINTTCIENLAKIKVDHPGAYKLGNYCANSTFINQVIFDRLAMGINQLTAVKGINDRSLTWTLGYVLIGSLRNS